MMFFLLIIIEIAKVTEFLQASPETEPVYPIYNPKPALQFSERVAKCSPAFQRKTFHVSQICPLISLQLLRILE